MKDGAPIEYVYMAEPTVTNRFNFGACRQRAASERRQAVHGLADLA